MIKTMFAVAASAALCSSARAETVDELYAKARNEGTVVFYGSGPTALWEKHVNLFKQRYPGIDVKLEGGFSNVLDKKVDEQIRASKLEVDVIVLQLVQDFERWKKEGLLLPFKPEGFDKIDANWKDADGMYVGVTVFAHSYAYNSDLVKPEDVPKSALDFLKPQFQGKVVSAYPQDDDTTLYVFDSITRKYGLSYWDEYFANKPAFYQGHRFVRKAMCMAFSRRG